MKRCAVLLTLLALLSLLMATAAQAHKGSDAYLEVQQGTEASAPEALRFTLAVAIKDLDLLLPMDANADARVTWGEIRAAMPQLLATMNLAAALDTPTNPTDPACHLRWQFDGVDQRGDGAYVRLVADVRCPASQPLALRYTLFREQDANHRLLVAGRLDGRDLLTSSSPLRAEPLVLRTATPSAATPSSTRGSTLHGYFVLGVQHLLEGYDHLAFLLALVLPLRLALFSTPSTPSTPVGTANQRSSAAWWALLRTVTAFTVGHSITLMMATFGWTDATPAWVEPAIALSIAVTALLNLWPLKWVRTDVLALLFGMVHGIGFAALLQEAAAPIGLLPWALAGFNLGVEAGQLIAVGAWVLLVQPVVARRWYPTLVLRGGSVLLVLLAAWWFWQRVQ